MCGVHPVIYSLFIHSFTHKTFLEHLLAPDTRLSTGDQEANKTLKFLPFRSLHSCQAGGEEYTITRKYVNKLTGYYGPW